LFTAGWALGGCAFGLNGCQNYEENIGKEAKTGSFLRRAAFLCFFLRFFSRLFPIFAAEKAPDRRKNCILKIK